jgi:hypothetical protein
MLPRPRPGWSRPPYRARQLCWVGFFEVELPIVKQREFELTADLGRVDLSRSGRSSDWLKMKNPACEAVKREAEEDWGR